MQVFVVDGGETALVGYISVRRYKCVSEGSFLLGGTVYQDKGTREGPVIRVLVKHGGGGSYTTGPVFYRCRQVTTERSLPVRRITK